ncbi:purine-binding chemotaxis protein CheW [bacterium]|nr:purine-binding chemotaxis protein CheW [bacterium]
MTMDTQVASLAQAGKYLSFILGGEEYGVEIMKVQEINGLTEVTRVPRMPEYVRGVVNLRGKVIPVIDLRSKFGMEKVEDTEKTCNIVVQIEHNGEVLTMGIVVDDVSEVLNIAGEQIDPAPAFGSGVESDFITGIGKLEENVVILLDINRILGGAELAGLATIDAWSRKGREWS